MFATSYLMSCGVPDPKGRHPSGSAEDRGASDVALVEVLANANRRVLDVDSCLLHLGVLGVPALLQLAPCREGATPLGLAHRTDGVVDVLKNLLNLLAGAVE